MASSTTTPMASAKPSKENVFNVKPNQLINMKVPIIEVGMASTTFTVADSEPKNSQQTNEVKIADRIKVNTSSATDSRINFVRSKFTPSFTPSGKSLLM